MDTVVVVIGLSFQKEFHGSLRSFGDWLADEIVWLIILVVSGEEKFKRMMNGR